MNIKRVPFACSVAAIIYTPPLVNGRWLRKKVKLLANEETIHTDEVACEDFGGNYNPESTTQKTCWARCGERCDDRDIRYDMMPKYHFTPTGSTKVCVNGNREFKRVECEIKDGSSIPSAIKEKQPVEQGGAPVYSPPPGVAPQQPYDPQAYGGQPYNPQAYGGQPYNPQAYGGQQMPSYNQEQEAATKNLMFPVLGYVAPSTSWVHQGGFWLAAIVVISVFTALFCGCMYCALYSTDQEASRRHR